MAAPLSPMIDESKRKTWLITGAGRGLGADFAKAALRAGHAVVATGRDPVAVAEAVGVTPHLLAAKLDVTKPDEAAAAAEAAVEWFGGIDVLVNNAANFNAGYFEELSPKQIERQLATSLIGPMNVTRAVLPIMRKQGAGHIISMSSGGGLVGFEFCGAYAASKFGLEGWMEALAAEVEPFGIATTIVNPGFFRTEVPPGQGLDYADPGVEAYAARHAAQREWWAGQDGPGLGDPAKLAQALLAIADEDPPPRRFFAGEDAVRLAEHKIETLRQQLEVSRELSPSLACDDSR